jgi:hypothetical protein
LAVVNILMISALTPPFFSKAIFLKKRGVKLKIQGDRMCNL